MVYVGQNSRISMFITDGCFVKIFGEFSYPRYLTVDSSGVLYVSDGNDCVQCFQISGK